MLMTTDENQAGDGTATEQAGDDAARRAVRIQLEETEAHETQKAERNMSSLSDGSFRQLVRSQYGFDPGV